MYRKIVTLLTLTMALSGVPASVFAGDLKSTVSDECEFTESANMEQETDSSNIRIDLTVLEITEDFEEYEDQMNEEDSGKNTEDESGEEDDSPDENLENNDEVDSGDDSENDDENKDDDGDDDEDMEIPLDIPGVNDKVTVEIPDHIRYTGKNLKKLILEELDIYNENEQMDYEIIGGSVKHAKHVGYAHISKLKIQIINLSGGEVDDRPFTRTVKCSLDVPILPLEITNKTTESMQLVQGAEGLKKIKAKVSTGNVGKKFSTAKMNISSKNFTMKDNKIVFTGKDITGEVDMENAYQEPEDDED